MSFGQHARKQFLCIGKTRTTKMLTNYDIDNAQILYVVLIEWNIDNYILANILIDNPAFVI